MNDWIILSFVFFDTCDIRVYFIKMILKQFVLLTATKAKFVSPRSVSASVPNMA